MASDYLLEIDGIKGESFDDKHRGAIEVDSFSWGLTQTGTAAAGGGGGAGKAVFQDFHFVSRVSKASPLLMLACASGQHIKKAVLFVRKSGGHQEDYYEVEMGDLLISSYQSSGADGSAANDGLTSVPADQCSLNFAKIEFSYKPQNADGSLDAAVKTGWDLKANKKI